MYMNTHLMLYISLKFKYGHMPYSRIHNPRIISYHIKQFKVLYMLIDILLDNETLSICIPLDYILVPSIPKEPVVHDHEINTY